MESIGIFLTSPIVAAIGWAVVHSLWQITIIVLLYHLIVVHGEKQKTKHQYLFAYSALLLQLVASMITFFTFYQPALGVSPSIAIAEKTSIFYVLLEGTSSLTILEQIRLFLEPLLPLIVSIWIIGMLFFFMRMLVGYVFWYRIKTKNTSPIPEGWQIVFLKIKDRMNISSRVGVVLSSLIVSPVLVGHLKPVILLPLALVNQLTTAQVEVILAHELAHFKRYDFIMNVIQLLIESIFYYHPAIWWLGQQIRNLRENCADDLALEYTNDSIIYARTLLRVAEQNQVLHPSLVMNLLGHKKHLLTRIQRILQQPVKQPDMREKFVVTSLLLVMAVVVSIGAVWSSPDSNDFDSTYPQITLDTLPQGAIKISVNEDGETMKVSLKDGEIKELSINGDVIPSDEFSKYEEKVEKMLDNLPPPPPPLAPNAVPSPTETMSPPPPPPPPPPPGIEKRNLKMKIHRMEVGDDDVEVIIEELEEEDFDFDYLNGDLEKALIEAELELQELKIEERREEIEVRMEERRDMMEKFKEEAREKMEEQMVRQEEQLAKMEARSEKMHEQIMIRAERAASKNKWLERELLKDGLIDDPENYTIKLNGKKMKVNGKNTSDELHEKYMDLYERHQGVEFLGNTSINVTKKKD